MDWPGIKVFYEKFIKTNTPVILHGFQSSWTPSNFSNPDVFIRYLEKNFGKNIVKVSVSPTGRFDGPEPGEWWGLEKEKEVLVRPPTSSMLFADFLFVAKSNLRETLYLEYLALHQYLGEVMIFCISTLNLFANVPTHCDLHRNSSGSFLCLLTTKL